MRLREEGAQVSIVGLAAGKSVRGKNGLAAKADVGADAVSADDFDAVVVPGGWAPDKLRRYSAVTGLVKRAYEQNKIVALICHAGLVGISAGIVRGHRATGSLGIKDDLVNAGATWVDEPAAAHPAELPGHWMFVSALAQTDPFRHRDGLVIVDQVKFEEKWTSGK